LYLFKIESFTSTDFITWLAVPADLNSLLFKLWTPVTYMFLHEDFWHIIGNMLWLFFLGRIFLLFIDQKKLFGVYIIGGLSGAVLYILAYNVFPAFSEAKYAAVALGASASVTAIVFAISSYKPNYEIRPFGLFTMKIKWLIVLFILQDLIGIPKGNAGGHIAHLGGAAFGYFFALQLSKGKDITKGFNNFIDKVVTLFSGNRKSNMKIAYSRKKDFFSTENTTTQKPKSDMEFNKTKSDEQNEIDRILDKISKSGYDSLSSKEKDFLFKFSKK